MKMKWSYLRSNLSDFFHVTLFERMKEKLLLTEKDECFGVISPIPDQTR